VLLHAIFPAPAPSLNELLRTDHRQHPTRQQRRAVEAALGWQCLGCEAAAVPSQLRGPWLAVNRYGCCAPRRLPRGPTDPSSWSRRPLGPRPARRLRDPADPSSWYLDFGQPGRELDVLLVRIPRAGRGKRLDRGDNDAGALKAFRDEFALRLWPPGLGKPDDSHSMFRWRCVQREWREGDPPNKGTELVEVIVAEREDILAPAPAVLVRWQRALGLAADVEAALGRMADEVLASADLLSPPTTAVQARALLVDRLRRGMEL
jgi:hypothetical protein